MFCNDEQIRMYAGNELVFDSNGNDIVSIEFTTIDSSKKLFADTGTVDGYNWTGKSGKVTFSAEANHIRMVSAKVDVCVEEVSGIIDTLRLNEKGKMINDKEAGAWYDLQGRKLFHKPTTKGLYIRNGKKYIIR
jgi:hypothetical protein